MKNAIFLQNLFNKKGHKTLAAGGFVRDFLLGRPPKDIDLATSAKPEQVLQILSENSITSIPTGLKHGTITAVMDKIPYEITTLRLDKICKGREAEVEYVTSFDEDAKRRDFTINALYLDLETKAVYDYVGGIPDLESKTLRFVGNAEERIKEDYLRILRYLRFKSILDFNLLKEDLDACYKYLSFLVFLSQERINSEICKIITGDHVYGLIKDHPTFLFKIFPELLPSFKFPQNCEYHHSDVFAHTLLGVSFLAKYKDPVLSLSHLFHDVAKPFCHFQKDGVDHFYGHEIEGEYIVGRAMYRLKFSNKEILRAKFLVRHHMRLHSCISSKALRRVLNDCMLAGDANLIEDLYKIYTADLAGMKKLEVYPYENIKSMLPQKGSFFQSPLSGAEIIGHFKLPEGKLIGKIKEFLIGKVVDGELATRDKEGAVELVSKYLEESKCKL